jgi:hypothetical protein
MFRNDSPFNNAQQPRAFQLLISPEHEQDRGNEHISEGRSICSKRLLQHTAVLAKKENSWLRERQWNAITVMHIILAGWQH